MDKKQTAAFSAATNKIQYNHNVNNGKSQARKYAMRIKNLTFIFKSSKITKTI